MLITFSGIVGSGKSTSAKHARDFLAAEQMQPVYLRFRFLSWRKLLQTASKSAKPSSPSKNNSQLEAKPRSQKTTSLSFIIFAGYLLRMLNFHLFRLLLLRNRIAISDRYFYDNLVHYHLKSRTERVYFRILSAAMPKPDIGFIMLARPEIIIQRRSHYEAKYIYQLHEKYKKISEEFCDLKLVETDNTGDVLLAIERQIKERLNGKLKG